MYTPVSSNGSEPDPLLADPNYPPEAINVLTKADLLAAIEVLKKATADPAVPPVYVIPSKKHAEALLDAFAGDPVDIPPVQENLFVIPPPAVPCGWTIEYQWREGEFSWATGERYDSTVWNHHGTYRCKILLKQTLRRLRYTSGYRKIFRVRVTLFDYRGDITWNGPPEVEKPVPSPDAPATAPGKNPILIVKHGTM